MNPKQTKEKEPQKKTKSNTNKLKLFFGKFLELSEKIKKPTKKEKEEIKLKLSPNALKVIKTRYLVKDGKGRPQETPEQMFKRVARHIAQAEKKYGTSKKEIKVLEKKFFMIMASLEFLPNSPTFTGAGTKLGQLSACFVLPIKDDMKSILKTQMDMGMIHKSGGGTGFSFSNLRPKNDIVGSTGGVSCGPVGFMQMYNDTTEQIKQGGTRRGANMGILRVDHPDILEFISYKAKEGTLANFNISVALTDRFMEAVKNNKKYELINPRNNKVVKKLSAKKVFDRIVSFAWKNGEPGLFFIDRTNASDPNKHKTIIESTNPCGEQPLPPYESCNLGSINLAKIVRRRNGKAEIDWHKLKKTISLSVRFLDNIIDINHYPLPEIKKATKQSRRIGLGLMGFADLLYQLEIKYDSKKGRRLAKKIMKFVDDESKKVSLALAEKRGSYPLFQGSKWEKEGFSKIRNGATTTIAPTGTLSIIASCSSGIEPVFALAYTKTVMDGTPLPEVNPYFKKYARKHGFYSKKLMEKIKAKGSIQDIPGIPPQAKRIFVTAADISWEDHVKMQAAFQKYVDSGISKTINFPNHATKKDVAKAFFLAYKLGCKGLTIYRDGSRKIQVLTRGKKERREKEETAVEAGRITPKITPRNRPESVVGSTYKIKTSYGNMYITINDDPSGYPFEIFTHMGKAGGFFAAKAEAISRLVSLALRSGVAIEEIIDQIEGIRGPSPIWGEEGMILSLPDAIAKVLKKHMAKKTKQMQLRIKNGIQEEKIKGMKLIHNGEKEIEKDRKSVADLGLAPACPECGSMLELGEGCLKCPSCGFSRCG